jgi:stress-induced morphogen
MHQTMPYNCSKNNLHFVYATKLGAYDDPNGSHISIEVVSQLFVGKRPVQRQQLVYKALWEELQGPVHAVDSMICKTPAEK